MALQSLQFRRFAAVVVALVVTWSASGQDAPSTDAGPNIPEAKPIAAVAFSPDGSRVLSGSTDGTLSLWDAFTGQHLRVCAPRVGANASIGFSPDGTRVFAASVVLPPGGAPVIADGRRPRLMVVGQM